MSKSKLQQNIILIGPMGAGKSTIGRLLAQELQLEFFDSDEVIESRTGATIAWIFDVEGEAGFRKRETTTINELTQQQGIVLATGGGVVLSAENRANIMARGFVIYLQTSLEEQVQRTEKDSRNRRPLLQNQSRHEVLENLFAIRDPLYRQVADFIVDTDRFNPKVVVNEIIKRYKQLGE